MIDIKMALVALGIGELVIPDTIKFIGELGVDLIKDLITIILHSDELKNDIETISYYSFLAATKIVEALTGEYILDGNGNLKKTQIG